MIRSVTEIGYLWPVCGICKHVAQEHDLAGCGARITGQCPTCHQHGAEIKCGCMKYQGPTWEQFKADYLTPEEIAYYKYDYDKLTEKKAEVKEALIDYVLGDK